AGIDGAWRWLAENPCALILLDLDLPGLDSEKFLGQLRQRGLADSLSVVALISTDTPRASLDAALAAGADGYLALPLTEADLRAQVAIHLRQRTLTNQLRASEARLAGAQRGARLGSWELDMASRQLRWSAQLARILGLPWRPRSGAPWRPAGRWTWRCASAGPMAGSAGSGSRVGWSRTA